MAIPPQLWSFTKKHQRVFETKECLATWDQSACHGAVVRAHIIPRSQLRQIAHGGRVVAVPTRLLAVMKMQQTAFEATEIGVGEFSTMNCFCASHDKTIFAPVEDAPLVFSSEQVALLHYRAVAAEFYQRRNQQQSAASELDQQSNDPQNIRFEWIHVWSSKAFEEARYALCHRVVTDHLRRVRFGQRQPAHANIRTALDNPSPLFDPTAKEAI